MKELIGTSERIRAVKKTAESLARSNCNVIIFGEPGTGKGVLAEYIHFQSSHASLPFAFVDLTAVDELELRLLTRSVLSARKFLNPSTSGHGDFRLDDGATLIFDNVDYSSLPSHKIVAKLIEGIREKGYRIRLIVLLEKQVTEVAANGRLDDELRTLIKDWEAIELPTLRDRHEDIPELVEYFVNQTAREMGLGEVVLDINAISILVRKEWHHNVQGLKSFIEQALMLSSDSQRFELPESLLDEQSELSRILERIDSGVEFALDRSMDLIEKRVLERVLSKFDMNQTRAARFLKIKEDTLRYRMKMLGIPIVQMD